jgi:hypothetical protein
MLHPLSDFSCYKHLQAAVLVCVLTYQMCISYFGYILGRNVKKFPVYTSPPEWIHPPSSIEGKLGWSVMSSMTYISCIWE